MIALFVVISDGILFCKRIRSYEKVSYVRSEKDLETQHFIMMVYFICKIEVVSFA